MKRKLLQILIPITLAVLGIIYFQVDWMYKTYMAEKDRVGLIWEKALFDAIAKFKAEQRTTDSTYIATNLRKWADTVKMQYINGGDSLHIQLEFKHPQFKYKPGSMGAMSFSWSAVSGVSIQSPTVANISGSNKFEDMKMYQQDKARFNIAGDSVELFFNARGANSDEKFFEQMVGKNREDAFKVDSTTIAEYVTQNLKPYELIKTNKGIPLFVFTDAPTYSSNDYRSFFEYHANLFHKYPKKTQIAVSFSTWRRWIIYQMATRVAIAVILLLIIIASFYYLIKIIKQQKQLADIKDDFIDNLTHEFKTPIATISAAIEGMQKFKALDDKEKTARYLEISKNELTRLNDMVTKLLNISVYDKNNLKLSLHHVDMVALIDDVVGMEQFRSVKPIKFTVHLDDAVKHIPADPLHFKNVLVNLVDNAVKYSKDSVEITIIGNRDKNMACFIVRDNGIGIPSAELKHVFDKFYRVPTGDMHNIKGSGLGLSYVKSVIEAHGGTITVNSEINVKTEFIISIPLK